MSEMLRTAFVIGRRDFVATVWSKSFLFFLLGPLFPLLLGALFGGIGQRAAIDSETRVVAVVADTDDAVALTQARGSLAGLVGPAGLVKLLIVRPQADTDALRQRLLTMKRPAVVGVLEGGLDRPRLTGTLSRDSQTFRQLERVVTDARRIRAGVAAEGPAIAVTRIGQSAGTVATARSLTARGGQALLFLLTILLAGMLLSQLIEEKSNKVIEILAAAAPIDAIFLGKLFAMLAVSLVGISLWATAGGIALGVLSKGSLGALPAPAVGWPAFFALTVLYFAMSYLLIGAAFLGIGAQASTVREVQTLSMPVTMAQVLIFAFASITVGDANSAAALASQFFPLSSPFAMLARAAEQPQWWPHLAALAWQALWVVLILKLATAFFRRSVLKSGPARRRWWPRRAGTA